MIATDAPSVTLPEPEEVAEVEPEEKSKKSRTSSAVMPGRDVLGFFFAEDKKKKKSKTGDDGNRKGDKEYGVSRGIDFYRVANIINFDFPMDFDAYVHRVGRTARVDQKGA